MEPKLLSFYECCIHIHLFDKLVWGTSYNGRFVDYLSYDIPVCFLWLHNGRHHRLDGQARITSSSRGWYFLGEYIVANSQDEFDESIVRKIG